MTAYVDETPGFVKYGAAVLLGLAVGVGGYVWYSGVFYGSATGTTAEVAKKIGELLGVSPDDIHNVADTAPSVIAVA